MSKRSKKSDLVAYLDEAIEHCAKRMLNLDADSDEYKKVNDQFMKLIDHKDRIVHSDKIKPETWALIISNIVGILIVLNYEHAHVVTSKAFSWITRPKL